MLVYASDQVCGVPCTLPYPSKYGFRQFSTHRLFTEPGIDFFIRTGLAIGPLLSKLIDESTSKAHISYHETFHTKLVRCLLVTKQYDLKGRERNSIQGANRKYEWHFKQLKRPN